MVAAGLDACFAQLLGTGVVHADPHYGNMLWTADGRLALLDFGLVTATSRAQRDAMARAILCLLSEASGEGDVIIAEYLPALTCSAIAEYHSEYHAFLP